MLYMPYIYAISKHNINHINFFDSEIWFIYILYVHVCSQSFISICAKLIKILFLNLFFSCLIHILFVNIFFLSDSLFTKISCHWWFAPEGSHWKKKYYCKSHMCLAIFSLQTPAVWMSACHHRVSSLVWQFSYHWLHCNWS